MPESIERQEARVEAAARALDEKLHWLDDWERARQLAVVALAAADEAEPMVPASELERIREHVRSYGMTPEGERDGHAWTLADVIEQAFVSHCAVEACSHGNEPRSHFCRRHRNLVAEYDRAERGIRELTEALRPVLGVAWRETHIFQHARLMLEKWSND